MYRPWAIVCDFDGTALAFDLGDAVAQHFAGEAAYQEAEERFRAGQDSFGVLLRAVFAPITASREEIAAFAIERAAWRPGFVEFLSCCQRAGHRVLVLGDGAGDRCAAAAGDLVFARAGSSLVGWCRERHLVHSEFSTFHEVLAQVPELSAVAP